MDGYLSKPVEPAMLYAVVEEFAPVPAPVAVPAAASPVDDDALRERLGRDDQLVNEVIHTFLTELDRVADQIGDDLRTRSGSPITSVVCTNRPTVGSA